MSKPAPAPALRCPGSAGFCAKILVFETPQGIYVPTNNNELVPLTRSCVRVR